MTPPLTLQARLEEKARIIENGAAALLDDASVARLLREAALALPVEAEGRATGWQPIETAPKDGTRILLARKQVMSGELIVVSGHWNSGGSFSLPHWSTPNGMHDPTHWQPLPAPPARQEP